MSLSPAVIQALTLLARDMPVLARDKLQADLRMNAEFGVETSLSAVVKEIIKNKPLSEQIEIKEQIIDLLKAEQDKSAVSGLLSFRRGGSKRKRNKRKTLKR